MKKRTVPNIILCNGAVPPSQISPRNQPLKLEYLPQNNQTPNVRIALPNFIKNVFHLPHRLLDLLEIAAYIFTADRLASRGHHNLVEYHSWEREFKFYIRVRDIDFWSDKQIQTALTDALKFMTGDKSYEFNFQPGHETPPTSLFDKEEFAVEKNQSGIIMLFSGGLDSLAGVADRVTNTENQIFLVSHQSGQPSTRKTQNKLADALKKLYPKRIHHYTFECGLTDAKRIEETQRTRSFLYTSIAYALSYAFSHNRFYIYENGVTAINLPKRQDLINARASRTVHPKTIYLLKRFFTLVQGSQIHIETPLLLKTKTEVFQMIQKCGLGDLISSTVSCSKTTAYLGTQTHCGGCSQCVDRRFAAYGASMDDTDESGLYNYDFIQKPIKDGSTEKSTIINYILQAREFAESNSDRFANNFVTELVDLLEFIPDRNNQSALDDIYNLYHRYGEQTNQAIKRIIAIHDNPYRELPENSLLSVINKREYLKNSTQKLMQNDPQDTFNTENKNHNTLRNVNTSKLHKVLTNSFSLDEMKTIAFYLKIDYENLPQVKEGFARELIAEAQRRQILNNLLEECQKERPNENWES